jgi:hypothetical protein
MLSLPAWTLHFFLKCPFESFEIMASPVWYYSAGYSYQFTTGSIPTVTFPFGGIGSLNVSASIPTVLAESLYDGFSFVSTVPLGASSVTLSKVDVVSITSSESAPGHFVYITESLYNSLSMVTQQTFIPYTGPPAPPAPTVHYAGPAPDYVVLAQPIATVTSTIEAAGYQRAQLAANVGYVDTKIGDLINSAPAALDTLKEIADVLGDPSNLGGALISQLTSEIATRASEVSRIDGELALKATSSALSSETSARQVADLGLQNSISAVSDIVVTKASLAELNAEAGARASADTTLQGNISTLANRAVVRDDNNDRVRSNYVFIGDRWRIRNETSSVNGKTISQLRFEFSSVPLVGVAFDFPGGLAYANFDAVNGPWKTAFPIVNIPV